MATPTGKLTLTVSDQMSRELPSEVSRPGR